MLCIYKFNIEYNNHAATVSFVSVSMGQMVYYPNHQRQDKEKRVNKVSSLSIKDRWNIHRQREAVLGWSIQQAYWSYLIWQFIQHCWLYATDISWPTTKQRDEVLLQQRWADTVMLSGDNKQDTKQNSKYVVMIYYSPAYHFQHITDRAELNLPVGSHNVELVLQGWRLLRSLPDLMWFRFHESFPRRSFTGENPNQVLHLNSLSQYCTNLVYVSWKTLAYFLDTSLNQVLRWQQLA